MGPVGNLVLDYDDVSYSETAPQPLYTQRDENGALTSWIHSGKQQPLSVRRLRSDIPRHVSIASSSIGRAKVMANCRLTVGR